MKTTFKPAVCFIMLFMLFPLTGTSQWTWLNPRYTSYKLNDVAFVDSLTGYIAGDHGTLMKTIDGGNDWSFLPTDLTLDLTCIFKVNSSVIYISGDHGVIMKSMNGGDYWRTLDSGFPLKINSIWFTSVDTGYGVGPAGAILKTTDGAETWTSGSLGQWTEFFSVCFTSEDTGFIAGRSGKIYKTNNGGKSWHLCPTGTEEILYSLCFTDSQTGYATGEWSILKTIDGGLTWSDKNSESRFSDNYKVFFINHDTGFIAKTNGSMLRTFDEGETWTFQNLCQGGLFSVNFFDPLRGFAVGNYGIIQSTTDCGESWNCSSSFYDGDLLDACFLNPDTGYIASYHDLFRTNDGGQSWTQLYIGDPYDYLSGLVFINADTGFFPEGYDRIIKTMDGGQSWSYIYTGFDENERYYELCIPGKDTAFLLGRKHILRSVDACETWEEVFAHNYLGGYMKFMNNRVGVIHYGTNVFHTEDAGETWSQFTGAPSGTVYYYNADTGYVSAQYGFLNRTVDGGFSWEIIYDFDIEPRRIYFADRATGYACGDYGKLYKTIDGGFSWADQNTGTQNTFSFLAFPDTSKGYTGGEGGMILKYESGLPVVIPEILTGENSVRVYPNPFSDQFNINFFMDFPGNVEVEIFDLSGKPMRQLTYGKLPVGNNSIVLDGNLLVTGIYVMNIKVGNQNYNIKILKL